MDYLAKGSNFIAFPLLWLIVVTSASRGEPLYGELAVAFYITLHTLIFIPRRKIAFLIVMSAIFIYGFAIESIFKNLGALKYASDPSPTGFLSPLWVVFLYPLFAISSSLFSGFLRKRLLIASLLGLLFGPLSYYNASLLGAATYPNGIIYSSLIIGMFWAISFPIVVKAVYTCAWYQKKCPHCDNKIHFEYCSDYPVSVEEIFQWHENPEALTMMIPPNAPVTLIKMGNSLKPGEEIHLKIGSGLFSTLWIAKHTAYEKNHFFEDIQKKGPFSYWRHRHLFIKKNETNSTLCDKITFTLPLPSITHPLFAGVTKTLMHRAFRQRHETLKDLLVQKKLNT